jgi:hypothetical protein
LHMKNFWMLFSLFLLTLSVYPCGEAEVCETSDKISKLSDHRNHSHETEQCTPFCTCSHCPAAAFYPQIPLFDFKVKSAYASQNPTNHYTFIYTKDFSLKIWQPPKIS